MPASSGPPSPRLLLISRHAPYGQSLAREALDVALAAGAMGMNVSVLFMEDGVYQLCKDQQAELDESAHVGQLVAALPQYGVKHVYVEAASLQDRGLSAADLEPGTATLLEQIELQALINECKVFFCH